MDKYLYWLDRIKGLGSISKRNLMEAFGSAREVYFGKERQIRYILDNKKWKLFEEAKKEDPDNAFEQMITQDIQMVAYMQKEYPEKLIHIPDPPFCIYYKGKMPEEDIPSVAIIGARECSGYGEYIARELGRKLGSLGIQVISGMARGIDGISQTAALKEGGSSYGVMGCGVDICYPKSNQNVYDTLLSKGGILSSYLPGTMPQARLFPPRNRIVSGLADVLVVIEARQQSGTSITVEMALEQGREIYAVPGRVTDRLSDGCNKMIKDGAHVFLSPEDFVMDLRALLPEAMKRLEKKRRYPVGFSDAEREGMVLGQGKKNQKVKIDSIQGKILQVLDFYPKSLEEIGNNVYEEYKVQLRAEELSRVLMQLCLLGEVKQDSPGWFSFLELR